MIQMQLTRLQTQIRIDKKHYRGSVGCGYFESRYGRRGRILDRMKWTRWHRGSKK